MNKPEMNITYECYHEGNRLIGTAEVELPELTAMTQEVSGGGIAGQVDSPVLGHFQAMSMTVTWRTVTEEIKRILTPQYHHIELWAAIQTLDPGTGKFKVTQQKIITRAVPKAYTLGNLQIGQLQGTTMEFGLNYCKMIYDGKEMFELDMYNFIYQIDGVDQLAEVKSAVGLT
jgi:P2 family phage contractile tail tube protein